MRRVILFEPEHTGHHLEFLRHVLSAVADDQTRTEYLVVANGAVTDQLRSEYPGVKILGVDLDFARISEMTPRAKGRLIIDTLRDAAREFRPDLTVVFHLNSVMLPIATRYSRCLDGQISGIYFAPYVRIDAAQLGVRARVTKLRKRLALGLMVRNPQVGSVFVLNDEYAAERMNRDLGTSAFRSLGDPVREPAVPIGRREPVLSGDAPVRFLLCGTLSERKGVPQLVAAVRSLLAIGLGDQFSLAFVGAPSSAMRISIRDLIADVEQGGATRLRADFGYVSDSELDRSIQEADIVLLPYQRAEASSGILGRAALYETPVLGPDSGLIGDLIQEYGLGSVCDTRSPVSLASALRAAVEEGVPLDRSGAARYVSERSPGRFAASLLDLPS